LFSGKFSAKVNGRAASGDCKAKANRSPLLGLSKRAWPDGVSQSGFRANDWKLPCISALGMHRKGMRREGARSLIAQLVEQSTVIDRSQVRVLPSHRPTASDSIHLNPRIILHTALYVVQWRRELPKTSCWHPTNLLVYLRAYQQLFGRDTRNAKRRERPQKLSDGGGLHLLVNPDGARYWRMAYRYQGRQKTLALGVYPIVSLADARTAQDAAKKLLACDVDPSQARKKQKRAGRLSAENTFEIVAREWCENQKDGWTARYHDHLSCDLRPTCFRRLAAHRGYRAARIAGDFTQSRKPRRARIAKRLRQTVGQVFRCGIVTGRARRDASVEASASGHAARGFAGIPAGVVRL
jgi:hypothetical protein